MDLKFFIKLNHLMGIKIDEKALQSTARTLENRVNVLGVSEPHIQVEDPDRIRVQLAGKRS